MPITVTCPGCGKRFQVNEALAGRRGKCKQCGQPLTVPGATPEPADAAAAPAPPDRVAETRARRPALRYALLAVAGAAVLGGLTALLRSRSERPPAPATAAQPEPPAAVERPAGKAAARAEPAAPILADVSAGEIRTLEGHTAGVDAVAASPRGRLAFSGGNAEDRSLRLWDVDNGQEVRQLDSKGGGTICAAFAPDGARLLTAGRDNVLRLWDVATGEELRRFEGHASQINDVAFAPDGRHAASTSWDKTLRLWDVESGRELHPCEGHDGPVNGVASTPDGRTVVSASGDHTVRVWDVESGKELRRFDGHPDWVGGLSIAPDGRRVASGGGQKEPHVLVWDLQTLEVLGRYPNPPDAAWAVAFTKDGERLLSVQADTIVLRALPDGRELHRYKGHSGQIHKLAVLPDGRRFLSVGSDPSVRLWGLPPAAQPAVAANGPVAPAPAARVKEADPAELLTRAAALNREFRVCEDRAQRHRLQAEFRDTVRRARSVFAEVPVAVGKSAASFTKAPLNMRRLGFDGVRIKTPPGPAAWDFAWEFVVPREGEGSAIQNFHIVPLEGEIRDYGPYEHERDDNVPGVDLPRNVHVQQELERGWLRPETECILWFAYVENAPEVPTYVKIWLDPTSPKVLAEAHREAEKRRIELPEPVSGLAFSADGRRGLIASGPALLAVDLESGRTVQRTELHAGNVRCVAFARDGRLAAVGSEDHTVRLVETATGKEVHLLRGHGAPLRCVAFAPDGRLVASGAEDHTARLWDVATGKEKHHLEGHTDQVLCVAFSPDGRRLVTGASINDPVGRVWDTETGSLVCRLEGNDEAIYAVAFAPDSRTVLTGGEDDKIRHFDAQNGRLLRTFKSGWQTNVLAVVFLPDGRRELSGADDPLLHVWDVGLGRELASFTGHLKGIGRIAVSDDGQRVLTASLDFTVRLWQLPDDLPSPASLDGPLPTQADLDFIKSVTRDLGASTPEELAALTELRLDDPDDETHRLTDAALAHVANLRNLESLSVNGGDRVRGPGLAHLKGLTRLKALELGGCAIGDDALRPIVGLTGLKELGLGGTRVSDAGLAHLKGLANLEELTLSATRVRGPGLAALGALSRLKMLDLSGPVGGPPSPLGATGIAHLTALPALERLSLDNTRADDAGLKSLAQIGTLRYLDLDTTPVTDAGLAHLKPLQRLEHLGLIHTRVGDRGLAHLPALQRLESLYLGGTRVTNAGLVHLKEMPSLKTLDLQDTAVDDAGVARLAGLPHLQFLDLPETRITDAALRQIAEMKALERVRVFDTRVTEAGLAALRKARPKLDVEN